MATIKGGLVKSKTEVTAHKEAPKNTLQAIVESSVVRDRFEKMLGKKSSGFLSSVLTVVNQSKMLQKATPQSILSSASIAASLDLPIVPSLGRAYIVPYGSTATFIVGVKGFVELAQRSGLYKSLNVVTVYEGEVKEWNKFSEDIEFGEKVSDKVIGYYAHFELLNGFKKSVYWTKEAVTAHAKRFSKSFGSGPWQTDFDKMAEKTVLGAMLRAWGPLSIEMQKAMDGDAEMRAEYAPDNADFSETIDADFEDSAEVEAVAVTEDEKVVDTQTNELLFTER